MAMPSEPLEFGSFSSTARPDWVKFDGLAMQLNAAGANLRSRWLGLPFGDQGLVLPRASFERLGGFDPALRYGEDHALVWRNNFV